MPKEIDINKLAAKVDRMFYQLNYVNSVLFEYTTTTSTTTTTTTSTTTTTHA